MPRLLHVIHDLEPGGAATQLRLLALEAAARGEHVAVASLRRPGQLGRRLAEGGVTVEWTPRRFAIDPFALVALRRQVVRRQIEIVQSWDAPSAAQCRWLKRTRRLRWVHTHRGGPLPKLAGVSAVVASDAVAAAAASAATSAPVTTAPNAYDPVLRPTNDADKHAARERLRGAGWDVPSDAPVLVCAVRLDDAASAKELAWASDLVRVVRPGLRLLVAGEGPCRLACERFAVKATQRGTVAWLGPCEGLATLYAAADVVWVGRGAGAAPTPAIEAMAAGKPVVMADGPGRELLLPHDTSSASPSLRPAWNDRAAWARATRRLLDDAALAAKCGADNAQRVRPAHDLPSAAAAHQRAVAEALR